MSAADLYGAAVSTEPVRTTAETDISARLDRLPWGKFHTLVVAALGITWILDGLEVTVAGVVADALRASPVLQFSSTDVGLVRSGSGARATPWSPARSPGSGCARAPTRRSRRSP